MSVAFMSELHYRLHPARTAPAVSVDIYLCFVVVAQGGAGI